MSASPPSEHGAPVRFVAIAFLLAAVLVIPAGLVRASGPNGTVRGVITDAVTGSGVTGAVVELTSETESWDFETTTGAGGLYALAVPNEEYTVRISHPDYFVNTTTLGVGSGLTVWNNMSLEPVTGRTAHLRGYVKDGATSAPITRGRVVAATSPYLSPDEYANASALDDAGYYAMDLVPTYYDVSTEGILDYTAYRVTYLRVTAGTTWFNISLTANPLVAWVNGTVRDASNASTITGALVTATVGGLRLPDMTTDASGQFSLHVPEGTVEITADAVGYAPDTANVYVYSPGEYTPTFALTRLSAGIRGVVTDAYTHAPLPGALVVANPFSSSGYFDEARTDASGSYRLNLTADDFGVSVTKDGYTFSSAYVYLSMGETAWINASLWPLSARVQGYLVDGTTGARVPSLVVYANDWRAPYSTNTQADASGFFSFDLPPSPVIMLWVVGTAPYMGTALYMVSHADAVTWANITLDRTSAALHLNVTDASTHLGLPAVYVSGSWNIGYATANTGPDGTATLSVAEGLEIGVYVYKLGYNTALVPIPAFSGTRYVDVELSPTLAADVTVRGYVRDALLNVSIGYATVQASGYPGSEPGAYTDSAGYYSLSIVAYPQTIRVVYPGEAAGIATVNPSPGSTIWLNFSLARDTTPPAIADFTATPATGLDPTNPTTLLARVNETSFEQAYISIYRLRSSVGNTGTFLNFGALDASTVSTTYPEPGNVSVETSWDTRTVATRLTDGVESEWWPAARSGFFFLVAVPGYFDNATLTSPYAGTALFDTRTGELRFVNTGNEWITPADQPDSTFTPYYGGLQVDLTTAAITGTVFLTGATYHLGTLSLVISPVAPGGTYAAVIDAWDAAGNTGRAAVLMDVTADTTAPLARAGPDQTVDQGATVTLDGRASSDNAAIVNYTWTFTDGTFIRRYGATARYVFANPGVYVITLTVRDGSGNAASDTLSVTVLDTAAPSVALTAPAESASLTGSVTLTATASDNVGVVRVEFLVDDVPVGNATAAPYELALDSRTLANGNHTIQAVAYDAAGNSATSTRHVSVSNAGGLGALFGDWGLWILLGAIIAVVAVVGIVILILLRRKPRAPLTVAPPPPGGSAPP